MARPARLLARVFALLVAGSTLVTAGPPFQTDDPEPVPWRHYEAYLFGSFDKSHRAGAWTMPAFEFNVGAAPNLQFHVVIPGAYVTPGGAFGVGDVEIGAKYRFVRETARRPQIGVFPMAELPTGDSGRGLGNGQLWARLPIWLQKSAGPWTTYGGVGYQVNHAPGMKDSVFAGWLVQRQVTGRLVLGAEVYHQGAQVAGGRYTTYIDPGGYVTIVGNASLLFMLGHTVSGESHTVGYLGLYYTWGPSGTGPPGGGGNQGQGWPAMRGRPR